MWKDIKYLLAYFLPLSAGLALYMRGPYSWSAVILAFVILPLFELLIGGSVHNFSDEEMDRRKRFKFFDWLLYLNVPIVYSLVIYYFHVISTEPLTIFEIAGLTSSVGTIVGSMGINVAHELGHRKEWHHKYMAWSLLIPALYLHFYIEHNRGHHKYVATKEDPASARLGESIYAFWVRSVTGGYLNAWKLEFSRLKKLKKSVISLRNEMIIFHLFQFVYLIGVGYYFGWSAILFAVLIAVIGFLLLESVNYIEHYGLSRKKLASGKYETVLPRHSWNSDHELGRIFLYELTRHSDHHYKATRKYQVLKHMDESPQLPYGYPASILIALVPPLWFKLINGKVETLNSL